MILRTLTTARPVPGLRASHSLSRRSISFGNFFDGKLFQVPKGFEKYLPKKNSRTTESRRSRPSEATKESKPNSGGGGKDPENPFKSTGGGSGGGKQDSEQRMKALALAGATLGAAGLSMMFNTSPSREISWLEFENTILPGGNVERIDIVNKTHAVIVRKNHSSASSAEPPVPEWAQRQESESPQFEGSRDPYDHGPSTVSGDASNAGHSRGNVVIDNKFLRVAKREIPETIRIGSIETFERKLDEAQKNLGITGTHRIPVYYVDEVNWMEHLLNFAPILLMMGFLGFMMSSAGPAGSQMRGAMGMMKSRAVKADKSAMTIRFKDVAGCDEAKKEITEFVEFLKDHKKFTDLGAKIPKGALLVGPPGTGKTLLAKATAGEADVPFFSVSGSDFTEMFVGVGAGRVRDLFKEARENAPCIVFIDEIDAVGGKRGKNMMGGNSEKENTLNQLLVEMDGFTARDNIVVLAGTNRADVLDPALLRPGRFDRQVQVDKPDIKGRKEIFEVYLKLLKLKEAVQDLSPRLAALTPGFSGADIANICNEAAIVAARKNKEFVDMIDFEAATDRVIAGLESHKLISPEEKRVVAYHEAGHAVAGWFLEYADPLLKVTIIPRSGGSLGFAQYLPKELFLRTKDQMLDIVCMAMAGRASEQVNFGRVTSGAADDLRRTTQIIYQMVQVYGMNPRVGQVSFPKGDSGGYPEDKLYSEATAEIMDEEVRIIVEEAYQRTLNLMEEKKEEVKLVAELLLKQETISHTDVAKLIGDRPFSAGAEYDQFVAHVKERPLNTSDSVVKNGGDDDSPPPPPSSGSDEITETNNKVTSTGGKDNECDKESGSGTNENSGISRILKDFSSFFSRSPTIV